MSGASILELAEVSKVTKCKMVDYEGNRTRRSEQEIHATITERRISRNFNPDLDGIF